jgi:hypothetical protein
MKAPFEGDTILHELLAQLIEQLEIDCVVETGTETGATAEAFAEMVDNVYTCDLEDKVDRDLPSNVTRHLGDSAEFLDMLLPELCRNNRILFFLDAHLAPDYTRVLDELDLLAAQSCPDIVIVIHDFQVPGNPELGFDTYDGLGPLCVELVDSRLRKIFPGGSYTTKFNSDATGAKRGVGIFYA